jgi:hypothetical protein
MLAKLMITANGLIRNCSKEDNLFNHVKAVTEFKKYTSALLL